jgi:predicted nucleic acid-binding Zn ribbon protein
MHGTAKPHQRKTQGPCCPVCGHPVPRWLIGRRKRFCSDACRDEARRARNFSILGRGSGVPRNAGNPHIISTTYSPVFVGRGSVDPQLWHAIVEVEVFADRDWMEVVSTDNVTCLVAMLRPRALREGRQ